MKRQIGLLRRCLLGMATAGMLFAFCSCLSADGSDAKDLVETLDGIGELNHLESVLKIDEIIGVQWVPGDGPNRDKDWSGVQHRIAQAGKKIYIAYDPENVKKLMNLMPGDMIYTTGFDVKKGNLPARLEELKRIGIENL